MTVRMPIRAAARAAATAGSRSATGEASIGGGLWPGLPPPAAVAGAAGLGPPSADSIGSVAAGKAEGVAANVGSMGDASGEPGAAVAAVA